MTGRRAVLDAAARERVADAIGRAEATTSAEIVVVVAARAGQYRSVALLAALLACLALPWPLIWLTRWSAGWIALAQALAAAAILAASLSRPLRVALTPPGTRRAQARDAARRAFWSRGLSRTRGRTGVLIHLALAERHAEIVADEGVLALVDPQGWNAALADLVAALARGETEAGLVATVAQVGLILSEKLPAGPDNPDELPNRVVVTD